VFLLAWLLPSWVVFELAVTKLPHYVLPLYPSAAMLVAGVIDTGTLSRRPWLLRGVIWQALLPLIAGALCVVALVVMGRQGAPFASLLMAGAVLTAFLGWRRLADRGAEQALLCGVMAAVLMSVSIFGVIAPRLRSFFPSAAIVELMKAGGCTEHLAVTTLAYEEPSLIFLAGTQTRATDVAGAVAFLGGGPCRFAVVEATDTGLFAGEADSAGLRIHTAGRIEGINYTKGTAITLAVFGSAVAR
jgi:hypothetical protein